MTDEPETSGDPSLTEAAFYGGTGVVAAFAVTLAIGLSIIGFHTSADSREARHEREAVAAGELLIGEGAEIYSRRCASCHGANGEGGAGPSFVGVVDRLAEADHLAVIRDGRSQMPAFAGLLSDEQIALVVAYEREVLNDQ